MYIVYKYLAIYLFISAGMRIGPEPTTDSFTVIMHGEQNQGGHQLIQNNFNWVFKTN